MTLDESMIETTLYWSRIPGTFLNKYTGEQFQLSNGKGPQFVGSAREWYETLVETIRDVGHSLALGSTIMEVFVSPKTRVLLESSVVYEPAFEIDGEMFPVGVYQGSIGKMGDMSILPMTFDNFDDLDIIVRVSIDDTQKFGRVVVRDYDIVS